jgi:hypothetical protein
MGKEYWNPKDNPMIRTTRDPDEEKTPEEDSPLDTDGRAPMKNYSEPDEKEAIAEKAPDEAASPLVKKIHNVPCWLEAKAFHVDDCKGPIAEISDIDGIPFAECSKEKQEAAQKTLIKLARKTAGLKDD